MEKKTADNLFFMDNSTIIKENKMNCTSQHPKDENLLLLTNLNRNNALPLNTGLMIELLPMKNFQE